MNEVSRAHQVFIYRDAKEGWRPSSAVIDEVTHAVSPCSMDEEFGAVFPIFKKNEIWFICERLTTSDDSSNLNIEYESVSTSLGSVLCSLPILAICVDGQTSEEQKDVKGTNRPVPPAWTCVTRTYTPRDKKCVGSVEISERTSKGTNYNDDDSIIDDDSALSSDDDSHGQCSSNIDAEYDSSDGENLDCGENTDGDSDDADNELDLHESDNIIFDKDMEEI